MVENAERIRCSFTRQIASLLLATPLLLVVLCAWSMTASVAFADPATERANETERALVATATTDDQDQGAGTNIVDDGDSASGNTGATGTKTDVTSEVSSSDGTSSAQPGTSAGANASSGTETQPTAPSESQKPVNKPTKAGWLQDADGAWYYFSSVTAAPSTGWIKLKGKWYYLDPAENGRMATGKFQVDGVWYVANSSGAMYANKWAKVGSDWYFATKSGALKTGWHKSGSKWYWLQPDKSGLMATSQWIEDKGKRYYLSGNGAMAKKWIHIGNEWYYASNSGAQIMNGWVKSGSKWYWLQGDKQGLMAANQWLTDQNKRYFLTSNGAMATKWFKIGPDWYYANKSGAQITNGWIKSGGNWYWLQGDKQGLMLANDTKTVDGKLYSFQSSGAMRANCQVNLGDGVARYAASSGAISRMGEYKDGNVVLTNGAGEVLSGWQKIAGKWFYGESGTGVVQTGWLKLGKTWYYLDNSGAMVTGTRTIDGKTQIFNGSGKWLGSDAMASKAQGYSSNTPWLILVDRGAYRVGVFHGSKGNWNREKTFSCVTGAPGSPTITGVFRTTGGKRMNLSTDSRARWCTQIAGGYFFHTILASDSELGHSLSHGCLRLSVSNAQWIYHNIGGGTTVVIYN